MKKKVLLIFGTRPEAIKMAPVYHALRERALSFEVSCCVTGQHREMLDSALETFAICPEFDLNIMRPGQDLFSVTGLIISKLKEVLSTFQPDIVLVHGDTTTTLAASIACFYARIDFGHVEAGLRTHNLASPFPEEFNRRLASVAAKWHFAPTHMSKQNLLDEGVASESIYVTGNTVIDALKFVQHKLQSDIEFSREIDRCLDSHLDFEWRTDRFVLITGHRRENFGRGFEEICQSLRRLAGIYDSVHFVYPVHLNPHVLGPVHEHLGGLRNVHLIAPLTYEPFVRLLSECYFVLTDSGGIQEEAPGLGKPVLVMREQTERPEAVAAGTVKLVGANSDSIVGEVVSLLNNEHDYETMSLAHNPYGDGLAAHRIAEVLENV